MPSFIDAVRAHDAAKNPPPARPTIVAAPADRGGCEAYVAAVIRRVADERANRNVALNTAAHKLGRAIGAGQLNRAEVESMLLDAAHANGYATSTLPGDGLQAALNTIASGINAGILKPDPIPELERSTPPPTLTVLPPIQPDGTWRTPDPLHDQLPDFPTQTLGWMEPAVLALSEQLQTPTDLVAMLLLATTGAAVRGRARIRINPGWDEPLNLYVAVILGAGETKSPALSRIAKPLRELEAELIEAAGGRISEAEQKHRMQEKRVRQAEDRAVKANGADRMQAEDDARIEAETLRDLEVPVSPRLLIGDITPEGLVRMLAEQGGALASLSAEGGLFDTFAGGRYSNGLANLDGILQAHDGREPILVDRKGAEPLRVERPCLTIGLAVQPQVLEAIGENDAAIGRGFLARWLYAIPRSRVGSRSVDNRVDSPLLNDFDQSIKGTYRLTEPNSAYFADVSIEVNLKLSSSSLQIHKDYRKTLEARRHPYTGDLAEMVAWANKLDGQLARLAGLLHLIDQSETVPLQKTSAKYAETPPLSVTVPESVMHRAVLIADYLIDHARGAHRMMSPAYRNHADERQVLGWVVDRPDPLAEFSVRDAFNKLRGRVIFHEVEAVETALNKLVVRGYLAAVPAPEHLKAGRPGSPRYLVNPAVRNLQETP